MRILIKHPSPMYLECVGMSISGKKIIDPTYERAFETGSVDAVKALKRDAPMRIEFEQEEREVIARAHSLLRLHFSLLRRIDFSENIEDLTKKIKLDESALIIVRKDFLEFRKARDRETKTAEDYLVEIAEASKKATEDLGMHGKIEFYAHVIRALNNPVLLQKLPNAEPFIGVLIKRMLMSEKRAHIRAVALAVSGAHKGSSLRFDDKVLLMDIFSQMDGVEPGTSKSI